MRYNQFGFFHSGYEDLYNEPLVLPVQTTLQTHRYLFKTPLVSWDNKN